MATKRRADEEDEELEREADVGGAIAAPDLGTMLLTMQGGTGNAAVADLLAEVEQGQRPAEDLIPGAAPKDRQSKDAERELKGAADRATNAMLQQRLSAAKASPFAKRIEAELASFERRLKDAREYGWLGTDAGVLSAELEELEQKLGRAEREQQASTALAAVDLRRKPLSERLKKAIMEGTAITKPGMLLYAPDDYAALGEIQEKLGELQKALIDNRIAVDESRVSLGSMSDATTAFARNAAAKLLEEAEKLAIKLGEIEMALGEITERHARANAEDREKLNQLMGGLEPRLRKAPRDAMAGGASRQEIDYLIKKAWLEQHELTQQLAKDEMWQLVTGFSPDEGKVCYFEIPRRMDKWRIHFSLDYGVMRAVDVTSTDSDIRDALMGASSPSFLRSHVTAEVLGRDDDRNPRFYYGATGMTLKRDFVSTREGKAVDRNKKANESALRDALDGKAEELVKIIHEVLEERKELKSVVVKVGESLQWAG
jgi:hypothetical protein